MRRRVSTCAAAVGVAIAVMLTGCTSGPEKLASNLEQSLVPAETSAARGASTAPYPGDESMHVVEKKGSIPPRISPSRWSAIGFDPAARSIDVVWGRGACEKKNLEVDFYVEETADSVVIDVYDDPRMPPLSGSCAAVSLMALHTVTLSAPLGSRKLLEHEVVDR